MLELPYRKLNLVLLVLDQIFVVPPVNVTVLLVINLVNLKLRIIVDVTITDGFQTGFASGEAQN